MSGRKLRKRRRESKRRPRGFAFETLEPRLAMAVVINEFLAANTIGLQDQDGDRADWVELYNDGPAAVSLAGWHLTDDDAELDKWTFPAVNIPAGGYLVVFASGKDRAVAGQQLHTNFALDAAGDDLVLSIPAGVTIIDAYAPFPPQLDDVSYGRGAGGAASESLVDQNEVARLHAPTSGTLGTTWTATAFNDDSWIAGDTPIGYERDTVGAILYDSYFEYDVNALMPATPTARDTIYMRVEFTTFDVDALTSLTLSMQYDDGFVAYLNGQEVARGNAADPLAWNSQASAGHADSLAVVYEPIPINQHLNKLVEGTNVLAIHGLNRSTGRQDFLIGPMLVADRTFAPVEGFMTTPTPGAANQQGTLGIVADTSFSVDRGFYDAPFQVLIATATPDAQIRYTVDGSLPTATTGLVYNAANPPLITTTTNLRAAAFKTGFTPSDVDTQTYIFLDDVLQQSAADAPPHEFWGQFGPDWEMDPNIVNHPTYAGTIKDDLQAVSTVSVTMNWEELFGAGGIYIAGKSIEKGASVEQFNASGSEEWQSDAAFEIMGGTSTNRWNNQKLSMRVTFKPPHGPTKLDAPLFVNPAFDRGVTGEFDTFILDAVYNFSWSYGGGSSPAVQRGNAKYIQDQFVADLQSRAGGYAPHGRYVHLYLNGLYWGMYYLHQRPDDSFAESYLGGDKDDYDVLKHNSTDVVAGDATAIANFQALLDSVRLDMTHAANYAAATQKLDVDGLVDYMIVNYYTGNDDWPHHNWYATFNRVDPAGKWRFHSWDAEHVLKDVNYNAIQTGAFSSSPEEIHSALMANNDYRLRLSDRVQKHFRNGGVMTPAAAAALYQLRMQDVDRAIVGESARWGDAETEPAFTRAEWLATQNAILNNYFPIRTNVVLGQFSGRGWLATLTGPSLNHYGGAVPEGFMLTIGLPPGAAVGSLLYYTLDGSDPRLPGGGLAPSAILYAGPIPITAGTQVRTRAFDAGQPGSTNDWSAEVEATYLPPTPFPMRITELHYNPAAQPGVADAQTLEFLELANTGASTVSLDGVRITEFAADDYTLPNGLSLAPGERIIVARNPSIFSAVYGAGVNVAPLGYANANLGNSGERIALIGPLGEVLQDFVFSDTGGWPGDADGDGQSLEIIDPLGNPADPSNWRVSFARGGSPGEEGAPPATPGDFNDDNAVSGADFLAWQSGHGLPQLQGTTAQGDANGDRAVDAADLALWSGNYGMTPAIAAAFESTSTLFALASAPAMLDQDEWILADSEPIKPGQQALGGPPTWAGAQRQNLRAQQTPARPPLHDAIGRFFDPDDSPRLRASALADRDKAAIDAAHADDGALSCELAAQWRLLRAD